MIQGINKVKHLGIFQNYSKNPDVPNFKKFNLIYGSNGSGKTTLSKLFSALGSENSLEGVEYEVQTDIGNVNQSGRPISNIRVFNQDYIRKYLEIRGSKARPILILGAENKELSEKIDEDEKLVLELEDNKSKLLESQRIAKKYSEDKFTDVAKIIGANLVGSASRNYRRPDAKKDFEKLSAVSQLPDKEVEQLKVTIGQEIKSKLATLPTDFDIEQLINDVESICKETVESQIINRLKDNSDISKWVESGLKLHNDHDSTVCEFCLQEIPEKRMASLVSYFNEADKSLKEKVDQKTSAIENMRQRVKGLNSYSKGELYQELRTKYESSLADLNKSKNSFLLVLSELISVLDDKKSKTTQIVEFNKPKENNFDESLDFFNEVISQHNIKTDNFQAEKATAAEKLKNHHLSGIHKNITDNESKLIEIEAEVELIDDGDDEHLGLKQFKESIKTNKSIISSEHKGCDELNKRLATFLGRDEIFFEVADEGGYSLKRKNGYAKNLSEGEKTAIAFVYFSVHLHDQDFDLENGIIVIDDPVSSFDSNSIFQAFSFVRNSVKDAKQVILLTHNFDFLKLLLSWLSRQNNKSYLMITSAFDAVTGERKPLITGLDKLLVSHPSEYHYLFKRLYLFKEDGTLESVYDIPNLARKLLETFLMFRVPKICSMYAKIESLRNEGIFDGHKLTAIYKFTNDQSHMTGKGFDPSLVSETKNNVKYLMELINTFSSEHYEMLVSDIEETEL